MHSYIGVVKQKAGVTQQNFESVKDALVKKQRDGINEKLEKAKETFAKVKKKHGEDLEQFRLLKNDIDILFNELAELREKLKDNIETKEKLHLKLKREVELIEGQLKRLELSYSRKWEVKDKVQDLIASIQDFHSDDYKIFFSESEESKFSTIQANIKAKRDEVQEIVDKDKDNLGKSYNEVKEPLESMIQSLHELVTHVDAKLTPKTDYMQTILKKAKENIGKYKGKTKIESLYDVVVELVNGLENQEVPAVDDIKRFLKFCDNLEKEKGRLEKVKSECDKSEDKLEKEIKDLEDDKERWRSDPSDDLCKKLLVYNSVNKCYSLKSALWCLQVLPKFITAFFSQAYEERIRYISSPVFLELFTNIIMPLMNDGTLEIALSILDPSKTDDAQRSIGLINNFYGKLTRMEYSKIDEKEIDNALHSMQVSCLYIAMVKLNHYAGGLSKDVTFVKSFTFNALDLQKILSSNLIERQTSSTSDPQGPAEIMISSIAQHLQQGGIDDLLKMLQEMNPMTHGIPARDINSGTTILSTLNFALKLLPILFSESDIFKDTSVAKAKKAIENLKEPNVKIAAYDELDLCYGGLQNDDKKATIWPKEELLTPEDQLNLEAQEHGKRVKLAQKRELPANLILDPNASELNFVSAAERMRG
ncbi:coiled-coil domain-containing protein [Wolbachia endosymbiont of Ctenocephalides felis wCfeT]|uniref:hypothetical protein n=1 Tax=Wolbachia endosymbiont of Ctenocephalides felis wCfeT TaxID=2732593 RepID=UPI001447E157|nr:hypothetical protein [Wolbachia endosymbiont of Ctenocephalides felis wCfeT]